MQIFLDTANLEDIRAGLEGGIVSGVTTNPSIIAREGKPFRRCVAEILEMVPDFTVLVEVFALEKAGMMEEARQLAGLGKNIVIKIPMTAAGLAAVRALRGEGIRTTVTLVFSLAQAVAASCAGADFVAPFAGRLDDIASDGLGLVSRINNTFRQQNVPTRIIAASIRSAQQAAALFENGCDIVTVPGAVLRAMLNHPLTTAGLETFMKDGKRIPVEQAVTKTGSAAG